MIDFTASNKAREVLIDYTNWRGERSKRRVSPIGISFEATKFHPEQQWLLWVIENKKGENVLRAFAMASIHSWSAMQ